MHDVSIIGGGLAGLSLSIQLAKQGHSVILFEKEQYPFHKVCGEYISLESWDFLKSLGIPLETMNVPVIQKLQVSSANGRLLQQELPLGGFGISRYRLDHLLAQLAIKAGVMIKENTKVNEVTFSNNEFGIVTSGEIYRSRVACASFGKRSNLDIKWKRRFTTLPKNKLNNYVGIKYHVRVNFPADTIALHLFPRGYCGIAKIEDDLYNLCYLTASANLQQCGNNIEQMEATILASNPHLKQLFSGMQKVSEAPVTISQISFDKKTQVEDHILMIGDAAGMITPLCGNGMSMALHGAKLAAQPIDLFLRGNFDRATLEREYTRQWQKQFSSRLRMGRTIQRLFGSPSLVNLFIRIGKTFPAIIRHMIRATHGKPF